MLALLHTLCDRSALLHTSKTSSTHCAIEMFHICTVNIVRPKFMYFPNLRAATDRSKASQKSILAINLWDNQGRTIPPSWWTCSIVWWGRKSLRYQQERMKRKVHAEFRPWSWEGETKLQVQLPLTSYTLHYILSGWRQKVSGSWNESPVSFTFWMLWSQPVVPKTLIITAQILFPIDCMRKTDA